MVTREEIFSLVKQYYVENKKEIPNNKAPVSGKIFNEEELIAGIDAVLDGWWTEGKYNEILEKNLGQFLGIENVLTVNSGSSANLVAFSALTSHLLPKEKRIISGSEVISVASAFPTTINPILQHQAVPVFLDVELGTYNMNVSLLEEAITPKTKAIFIAHTMGNPFDLEKIMTIAKKNNLWVIEDNCDSLGAEYDGKKTGTFGHISTQSFYPAHHITTAEGGSVATNDATLKRIALSIRDWGRDCWCRTGMDDTCHKRYTWKLGDLPAGYDHKYVYSHIGYNLKMTDLQAAIGVAQMNKLPEFCTARRNNFAYLTKRFKEEHLDDHFILPFSSPKANPCWFGYLLTVSDPKINREKLLQTLNSNGVATRLLFGGNMTKQPYFLNYNIKYRVQGSLTNTDKIMKDTFWIGLYPGLKQPHLEYIVHQFKTYINTFK